MKKIILTGGGTAGHVNPNIALLDGLKERNYDIVYIGGKKGMERTLIQDQGVRYLGISSGKLRRYIDFENVLDAARVCKGLFDALALIRKEKPNVIFSKGGYVSVPVVYAGWLLGVPVVIHESDISPGLANKLSLPYCKAVCASFPETLRYIKKGTAFLTGTPIRKELFSGVREKGLKICGFSGEKPVLLVMGGSLGAVKINACLRECIGALTETFDIVHLCGKGNSTSDISAPGYAQFEYMGEDLKDIFACTDIIVSRAGANSVFEFLSLKKPSLLIPLSKAASRGDQILNADSFLRQGFAHVLEEENLNTITLKAAIFTLFKAKDEIVQNMQKQNGTSGVSKVLDVIDSYCK